MTLDPEHVHKMKLYIAGKEALLEPQHYQTMCPIAAMIVPFLKGALMHVGAMMPTLAQQYQEAQFIFDYYTDMRSKITTFLRNNKLL